MFSKLSPPTRLGLYYLTFGVIWILGSGKIAEWLANDDTKTLKNIENYKGLTFILVSSFFIYSVARTIYKKLIYSLAENENMLKKYKAVMSTSKDGIYEYDILAEKVKMGNNINEILGKEILQNENALSFWENHIHPEDRQQVMDGIRKAYEPGHQSWQGEYRYLTPGKGYREIMHRIFFLKDRNDKPYSVIGSLQDVSDHRQLQREYHNQQLKNKTEMTRNIIRAEERERNRWAEELHDNIAQVLGVVKLHIGMISHQTESEKDILKRTNELVQQSISEIRHLSANLKPPVFEEQGLKESIQHLVANIRRVKELKFTLSIDDEKCDRYLNNEQKLMIYRIVQEQLNNIIKYAEAKNVFISIEIDHPGVIIKIKDDGVGFDPTNLESGIGLKNIRGRLNLFNGKLSIISAHGRGCELRAEFWLT